MSKSIYWINNNIRKSFSLAKRIFSAYWSLNEDECETRTNIILFGSSMERRELYYQEEADDLQHKIEDLLFQECVSLECPSSEIFASNLYQKYKHLVVNCVNLVYPCNIDGGDAFWEFCLCWKHDMKTNGASDEAKDMVRELISKMDIEAGSDVAIRLFLLEDDVDRICDGKCVVSMELYHQLKETCNCFLYTDADYDSEVIVSWKKIYERLYSEDAPAIISGVLTPDKIFETKSL